MAANTLKARYERLSLKRQAFLDRGREYAALSIPSLLPPPGYTAASRLPEPYSGLTSRAVVHLAARLMTALLPPGQSFYQLSVPPEVLMKQPTMTVPQEVTVGLARAEKLIQTEIERKGWRQPTYLTLQLLIVTGNAMEYITPENTIRVFRLDQYVVVRDPVGNVIEGVIEEKLSPVSLPQELQALVPANKFNDTHSEVELYTQFKLDRRSGKWEVKQELEGTIVPGSLGTFKINPYIVYRWSAVPGEDYGRSKVEEHIGDIRGLEALEKALLEGSGMAARNLTFVKPNATGGNLRQKIAKAKNGDVIVADPDDVHAFYFENVAGLQVTQAHIQALRENVAAAFLLNSGIRRDAERVTATEVSLMAEELEGTLGGVYSMLSQDMQRQRLERLIAQMQDQGKLPAWPKGLVEPIITTGLEALGRERDLRKIQILGSVIQSLGPEALEYAKTPELLTMVFRALELPEAVRTDSEVAELRQQKVMAEAAARGLGDAMGAAGEAAVTS